MPIPKIKKTWAAWALAAATLLLAVLLILSCLSIYRSGEGFSRALAAEKLGNLSWAFLLWLALLLTALFLGGSSQEQPVKSAGTYVPKPSPVSRVPFLRSVLYGLALIFILTGISNGGMWDVLVKAINICTECIGLG